MGGVRCLGLFPKKNRFFQLTPSLRKKFGQWMRRKKRKIFEKVMTDKHTDRIFSCRLCERFRVKRQVILGLEWNSMENFDIFWNKLIRVSRDLEK